MMNMMKVYDLTDDGSGVNYYDHRGTISIYTSSTLTVSPIIALLLIA